MHLQWKWKHSKFWALQLSPYLFNCRKCDANLATASTLKTSQCKKQATEQICTFEAGGCTLLFQDLCWDKALGNGTSLTQDNQVTSCLLCKHLARAEIRGAMQDTPVFTTASSLPHKAQPIELAGCRPQTMQELTGTAAYRAGCGTQTSVVLISYCEGYSCSRDVSLNAATVCFSSVCYVLENPITCSTRSYSMYLAGKR